MRNHRKYTRLGCKAEFYDTIPRISGGEVIFDAILFRRDRCTVMILFVCELGAK